MTRKSENTKPEISPDEIQVEQSLRPVRFEDFTGQTKITDNLKVFIGEIIKYLG